MPRIENYFRQLEVALQRSAPFGVTDVRLQREEARSALLVSFVRDGELFHGSISHEDLLVAFTSNLLVFLVEAFWQRPRELEI